jgi:hypothetical protein
MDNEPSFIGGSNTTFFNYMFSLADGEKIEIINTLQYVILAIIPILLIIKVINNYIFKYIYIYI